MSKKTATPSLSELMMGARPMATPPVVGTDPIVQFSNRIRASYKRQLSNLARRTFKKEQYHLDKALAAYLAQQKPDDLLDIPEE